MSQDPAFVLPAPDVATESYGDLTLYLPSNEAPAPVVLLIHGAPFAAEDRPVPSEWQIYRGYASQLADRGTVATVVNHAPDGIADHNRSQAALTSAINAVRSNPRVAADRLALWFFSGSGPLVSEFLQTRPDWLRCVGLTYPVLGNSELVTVHDVSPLEAATGARDLPIVMTVVGDELPDVAPTQPPFIAAVRAAGAQLQLIEVPTGRHGFDVLQHTDESRLSVTTALNAVTAAVLD